MTNRAFDLDMPAMDLRVLIVRDGQFWFAQGLELDYGAQGNTLEDAIEHFERGLAATVTLHVQRFGDIGRIGEISAETCSEIVRESCLHFVPYRHLAAASVHGSLPFTLIRYVVEHP